MSLEAQTFGNNESFGDENPVEKALFECGLSNIDAPRVDTPAYRRLIGAARGYMVEVKKVEEPPTIIVDPTYTEGDSYFRPSSKKKSESFSKAVSSSELRRKHHDTLAQMLLGKPRTQLSGQEADQLSNFAAYVTGNEGYVDSW